MAADNGRNYIIDRLRSKRTTIEDFNYDALTAPPLNMFLSPYDIAELRNIATSLRYSGKPEVKYKMIDDICRSRGLVKFGAGTNRVIYRHPEFNNILFKIAADDVGMGDNPAEFRNQFLLKPFCAKTFEISPCGTVAVVERVKPILSREEFASVAEDVFELLNTWIIGKFCISDCGSSYFMNFGCRSAFGVVVIDYPYLYEIDGKKLYCHAPDPNSPSGCCDGEIDYDDGFNILHCTKCGVKYRAKELAKNIEENKIVTVNERSNIKMNIKVSGGTRNINRVETVGGVLGEEAKKLTGKEMVKSAPGRVIPKVVIGQNPINNISGDAPIKVNTNRTPVAKKKATNEPIKTVNGTTVETRQTVEIAKPAIFANEKPAQPAIAVPKVNNIEETFTQPAPAAEPVKPAVIFGEKVPSTIENVSPVYEIEKALDTILANIKKIDIKEVKTDLEERMFDKLINSDVDKTSLGKLLIKLLSKAAEVDDTILTDPTLIGEFIEKYYDLVAEYSNDDTKINVSLRTITEKPKDVLFLVENAKVVEKEVPAADTTEETKEEEVNGQFNGIAFYSGKKINTGVITPGLKDEEKYDVIAVVDDNGNYLTDRSNFLITLDYIDNIDVAASEIVSKEWFNNVIAENETYSKNPFNEEEEKSTPVGALPQSQTEDSTVQQAMEDFIKNEK